jgi:hypothetical protein
VSSLVTDFQVRLASRKVRLAHLAQEVTEPRKLTPLDDIFRLGSVGAVAFIAIQRLNRARSCEAGRVNLD